MVQVIHANPRSRSVDVTLTINDIFDILNGLYILEGQKEEDIIKYKGGDSTDKAQLNRYKKLREDLQNIKNMIK